MGWAAWPSQLKLFTWLMLQEIAGNGNDGDVLQALQREVKYADVKVRQMKARLANTSCKAIKRIIDEYLAFIDENSGVLLGLREMGTGQFLVERTGAGRVEPWPHNGLNNEVVARFLLSYYWAHTGIGNHPRPGIGTMKTAEAWLHCAALRRCTFDSDYKANFYDRHSSMGSVSPNLRKMAVVFGREFTAPRNKKCMLMAADVDVLLAALDKRAASGDRASGTPGAGDG